MERYFPIFPEGHNPRGTTHPASVASGICLSKRFLEASAGVSSRVLQAFAGSTEFSEGTDSELETLGSCWIAPPIKSYCEKYFLENFVL